MEINKYCWK